MTAACHTCGRTYEQMRTDQKYCSASCRKKRYETDRRSTQRSGAAKRKHYAYEKRRIIGLDGEGLDNPPRYLMLLASNGQGIQDPNGLTTDQCLEFLVSLPVDSIKWGFGFSYDVNMILGTWPREVLVRLWNSISVPGGWCSVGYGRWWVKWIPGKQFIVKDRNTDRTCCVWDVLPFVQSSFVDWLEKGDLAPEPTIRRIREMKDRRDAFDQASFAEIEAYCQDEIAYLETGVRQMLNLFKSAGLKPRSYFGAGSLASALMRAHGVDAFIAPPPEHLEALIRQAFRGGRFELAFIGWQHEAIALDLNSAYPDAARRLPCLKCVDWRAVEGPPATEHALVRVRWDLGDPDQVRWGPFPVKSEQGPLSYPVRGEAWLWVAEVRAAQRVWPRRVRILESIELHRRCNHRPFDYVESVFDERLRLKALGDPKEQVLKKALAAMYGKLAQQVGDEPPFQSIAWAGMITSYCRAMILDAMRPDPNNVRMIATDGILVDEIPDHLTIGSGLGEWDQGIVRDILAMQPGLYFFKTEDGTEVVRSRGFGRADLSFEQAAQAIDPEVTPSIRTFVSKSLTVTTRRFRGLGSVVRQKAWNQWRRWIEKDRNINLNPWPRRGTLRLEKGRVETFAIDQTPEGRRPRPSGGYRTDLEREAEREPTDGGSLW